MAEREAASPGTAVRWEQERRARREQQQAILAQSAAVTPLSATV